MVEGAADAVEAVVRIDALEVLLTGVADDVAAVRGALAVRVADAVDKEGCLAAAVAGLVEVVVVLGGRRLGPALDPAEVR